MHRLTLLIALFSVLGASARAQSTQPSTQPSPLRADDSEVLLVALKAFNAKLELKPIQDGARSGIVLGDVTQNKTGMISPPQLSGEFPDKPLPADLVKDMMDRNGNAISLKSLELDPEVVEVSDLTALHRDFFARLKAFNQQFSRRRAYAETWLPGYSADGKRALVRFYFGPTPHGATMTYLLEKDDKGKWSVVWQADKYYL